MIQKTCITVLTKQNSSLQQKADKLQEHNTILEKKVQQMHDLNKKYCDVLKDFGFGGDNSHLVAPHTPENPGKKRKAGTSLKKYAEVKKKLFYTSTEKKKTGKPSLSRGSELVTLVKETPSETSLRRSKRKPKC